MPPPLPFTPDDVVMLDMTIRGRVVVPENESEYRYEVEKTHNAGFRNRTPLLFVLCHDREDVRTALEFCTSREIPVSVRSGGHSACGSSIRSDTVVVDLGRMRELSYVSD